MHRSILKSLAVGISIILAIAAVGCCHMSEKGKGKSCCGSGAKCDSTKKPALPSEQSVHP